MRFFTSDTHFGHGAVVEFCNRPFKDAEDMNECMIRRWNTIVKDGDEVYHLGDFSLMGSIKTKALIERLNGIIILIQGNHDRKPHRFFKTVLPNYFLTIAGREVLMSHYPYKGTDCNDNRDFSDRQLEDNGGWLLHGHVHCLWKFKDRMINVGVDRWAYAPVSEQEIADHIYNADLKK